MAFGQQSGPPATARQMSELRELVLLAGHSDLRDARHPLGLTQRQAGGKFTRDEADALIERLRDETDEHPDEHTGGEASAIAPPTPPPAVRLTAAERSARALTTEVLAAELQRRGWVVMEP